jgi:hypothetical protein
MLQAGYIYNSIVSKKKERFDIILEPLQAFVQLALLSFTPTNSKINIYNNVLYIQIAGWKQSIMRTYYNDTKNDLFYLFNVINRFNKFYNNLTSINNKDTNLFILLKSLATKGIDNLLQTYRQTENPALLHTLNIYKNMLHDNIEYDIYNNKRDLSFNYISNSSSPVSTRSQSPVQFLGSAPTQNPPDLPTEIEHNIDFKFNANNTKHISYISNNTNNIDDVFIKITNLYTEYDYTIIFNTLLLIEKNPSNYLDYIEGLNKILEPINKKIKKWIVDNIVY